MKRRYLVLASLVVLVAVGWSIFWSFAAGRVTIFVDDQISAAATRGFDVSCPGRDVDGWPFRMEIRCATLDLLSTGGGQMTTGPVRAVALAYDPRHVIVEADGPLDIRSAISGVGVSANWSAARASLRARGERLAAAALSISDMNASLTGLFNYAGDNERQRITAQRAEFHLRQSPRAADSADVALRANAVSLEGLFQGDAPLDVAILLHIANAADLLAGRTDRFMAEMLAGGRPIDVDELHLSAGDTSLAARGSLTLDASGFLSGELDITVVEPDTLARLLTPLYPQGSTMPTAFQGVVNGFGSSTRVDGRPAAKAKLRIDQGQVRIGMVPVAQIPPLF